MKQSKLWMRMGDQGDYEDFDDPYAAGEHIGALFEEHTEMPVIRKYGAYGVEVGDAFPGPYNYVSLFWGDDDAQPTKEITAKDIAAFKSGLAEGADIKVVVRKSYKVSSKSSKSRKSATAGMGRIR